MYIAAEVIEHPENPLCNHYETVSLLVVDPRADVPNSERCRLALEALFARDARVRAGHYRTITLAPFSARNPDHIALLRRGIAPDESSLVLTPDEVEALLFSE